LGEAFSDGLSRILFVSKEVWLDDSRPGEVTLVFVWESMAAWQTVGEEALQQRLLAEFDARFTHSYTMVRAPHDDSNAAIHRVSRFERCD
ncbi:MAG: TIGR03792 family protein, partial [Actinobacteria bacterium]|nr:TIGR03792 family protein [Actinomycetota bacterium]